MHLKKKKKFKNQARWQKSPDESRASPSAHISVDAAFHMAKDHHKSILFIIRMDNWCCPRVSSLNKTGRDGHSWEQESIFILAIKDSAPGTGARRLKKGKHVLSQAVLWLRNCLRETKAERGSQRKTSIINTVWCYTRSWWTNSSETTLKKKH